MKNEFFVNLLKDRPEGYPAALEGQYARILARIQELWGTFELDFYFEDLMIDKRGDRQGFPPEVVRDIFTLYQLWEKTKGEEPTDPWASETKRSELEKIGLEFTSRRFNRAVEKNELNNVILFLDAGMHVDTKGEAGWTPLMSAAFNGNEEIALLLLNRGASARFSDKSGYTPLHWAAYNGFVKATRLLLTKGAHVDAATRYGWTPLMQASARGWQDVVGILLDARADPNHSDDQGWTALHKALSNGHAHVARMLLSRGADPSLRHQSGTTPVDIARQSKSAEIRALLR